MKKEKLSMGKEKFHKHFFPKTFFQKFFNKKEPGTAVEAMMVFAVAFLIFLVVMTILLSAFANINSRWQARQTAREYLLVAETQGYLTSDDLNKMSNQLKAEGLYNIDYSGTTTSKVPYGTTIYVHFKANIKDHAVLGSGKANDPWSVGTKANTIEVIRQSTAKQQE